MGKFELATAKNIEPDEEWSTLRQELPELLRPIADYVVQISFKWPLATIVAAAT